MKVSEGSDRAVRGRGIEDNPWTSSRVYGGVFAWDAERLGRNGLGGVVVSGELSGEVEGAQGDAPGVLGCGFIFGCHLHVDSICRQTG